MLPITMKHTWRILGWVMFITSMLLVAPAYAQNVAVTAPDAQSMLMRIASQTPNLIRLVTAVAYVMGMFFMITAIIKFKHLGESRTMMSQEHSVTGPLVTFLIGAALIYLPSSVQVGMSTFWTNPNPFGYTMEKNQWMEFFNTIVMIMQLIGIIAFIRGLVILTHVGSRGGQQSNFGKGLTHVVAGVMLINIYQFIQVIMATLGIAWS